MIALLFFIAISSSALSASQFGLEVSGTHSSGCLIVKNATGKAAACGVRHLDLVCSINDKVVSKQEALSLSDATPCSRLVIKRHSLPCAHVTRSIPAGNGIYDIGLSLKAQTHTRASDPSAITTQYIVDASLSSDYAVEPGDWVRTVGGLLLFNKSPEQVKKIMSGARASVVEVCWWSADVRLEDISSGTLTSSAVLLLSAAAVLIFSFLALRQTPKGEKKGRREAEAAEAARLAEVARQQEAARLAEIAKQHEAAHLAEIAKQEAGRLAAAETARQAEIARQEAARQAEIAKQQEAARLGGDVIAKIPGHGNHGVSGEGGERKFHAHSHTEKNTCVLPELDRPRMMMMTRKDRAPAPSDGGHAPSSKYTGEEPHHLEAVPTGGGGDCLFHALFGALQDFSHRRQHSDYLLANDICLPHTHQEMRHVVVSFASDCRRMHDMFIDSNHYFTLEQAVDTDSRSFRGNNVVLGSEGNVVFHNVDEYFQIMRRDGSWGQHYEVMAAAALFQVCIEVHRPENNVVQVFGRQNLPRIYFRNKQEQHYEWMRPLYAREV